jgi:hypothetical protein
MAGGVSEYWIASPDARIISRWRSVDDPGEVFSQSITWQPSGMPAPLVIDLPGLYDEASG